MERPSGTAREQRGVSGNLDEAEAFLNALGGRLLIAGDAGHNAMRVAGVENARDGVVEARGVVVGGRRKTEGDAEVGGSDVYGVDARHGEDVVDLGDRLARLDHHDAEDV